MPKHLEFYQIVPDQGKGNYLVWLPPVIVEIPNRVSLQAGELMTDSQNTSLIACNQIARHLPTNRRLWWK